MKLYKYERIKLTINDNDEIIRAIQFTGDNWNDIVTLCPENKCYALGDGYKTHYYLKIYNNFHVEINIGDYIVFNDSNEIYPTETHNFENKYNKIS